MASESQGPGGAVAWSPQLCTWIRWDVGQGRLSPLATALDTTHPPAHVTSRGLTARPLPAGTVMESEARPLRLLPWGPGHDPKLCDIRPPPAVDSWETVTQCWLSNPPRETSHAYQLEQTPKPGPGAPSRLAVSHHEKPEGPPSHGPFNQLGTRRIQCGPCWSQASLGREI